MAPAAAAASAASAASAALAALMGGLTGSCLASWVASAMAGAGELSRPAWQDAEGQGREYMCQSDRKGKGRNVAEG